MEATQTPVPVLGALEYGIDAQDAQSAITRLCLRLSETGSIPTLAGNAQAFAEAVLNREADASTALPVGVAMPHARITSLSRITVAVGTKPSGIAWGDQTVQAVFLMAVPTSQSAAYLAFVQKMTRLFRDARVLDGLKNAPDEATCRRWLAERLNLQSV
jgi:PTS system fructose-specific IIC component